VALSRRRPAAGVWWRGWARGLGSRLPPAGAAGLAALLAAPLAAQTGTLAVVPRPDSVVFESGAYLLRSPVRIAVATPNRRLDEIGALLRGWLASSGYRASVVHGAPRRGDVALALNRSAGDGPEAYTLRIAPRGIRIAAPAPEGVLWGAETLRQLLPAGDSGSSGATPSGREWRAAAHPIPAVSIRDAPRFAWRGALLDAGRHFFPVPFVERFVDLLARYKLNVLHWHLTEDQGWRLAVPKWPRLTSVGAWRTEVDGTRYGGFYTRADVRRVVGYARQRGVTVMPEIEMPGHSVAAIASYPWLGCTGDSIPVANNWGVHADVYCPREATFAFLESVLGDVVRLFPSRFVHVGGDEVPKDRWKACGDCQALMRAEGMKDEEALQAWFMGRIGRWLTAHGRRLVGWDEITSGPLPPDAVVEVWRDTATIAAVARMGHDVIASPGAYTYLDHAQSNLTLAKVYAFEPVPTGLTANEAAHILGGEAPLWSEEITTANFDLMAFPRLLAFAEALWSRGPRDLAEFRPRLAAEGSRLGSLGVAIGPEDHDVLRMTPVYDSAADQLAMRVETGVPGIAVHYTADGSGPTDTSPLFADSIRFSTRGTTRLQAYYRGVPLGNPRTVTIAPNLARGRPYTLTAPPGRQYPGTGPRTLTDGALGTLDFSDGLWQGWQGTDLEAGVDLGSATPIATVTGSFQQTMKSWILLPRDLTVWLSDDGVAWREAGSATSDQPMERADPFLYRLTVSMPPGTAARWVKVRATNPGPLPAWHRGAGQPSWIFCDEIVVR
jgi:hexosaminidase